MKKKIICFLSIIGCSVQAAASKEEISSFKKELKIMLKTADSKGLGKTLDQFYQPLLHAIGSNGVDRKSLYKDLDTVLEGSPDIELELLREPFENILEDTQKEDALIELFSVLLDRGVIRFSLSIKDDLVTYLENSKSFHKKAMLDTVSEQIEVLKKFKLLCAEREILGLTDRKIAFLYARWKLKFPELAQALKEVAQDDTPKSEDFESNKKSFIDLVGQEAWDEQSKESQHEALALYKSMWLIAQSNQSKEEDFLGLSDLEEDQPLVLDRR